MREVLTAHVRAAKFGASTVSKARDFRWDKSFPAAHRVTANALVLVELES